MSLPEAIYITIGNSDDKLPQRRWAEFYADVDAVVRAQASKVHGAWMSNPIDPWQNACWCVEAPNLTVLERDLAAMAYRYGQDSIAVAGAAVQFVEPLSYTEYLEYQGTPVIHGFGVTPAETEETGD